MERRGLHACFYDWNVDLILAFLPTNSLSLSLTRLRLHACACITLVRLSIIRTLSPFCLVSPFCPHVQRWRCIAVSAL